MISLCSLRCFITYAVLAAATADGLAQSSIDASRFEKHVVVSAATDPMQMDLAPDGRLFFAERAGAIKICRPETGVVVVGGRLEVGLFGEVGLMGLVLSHDFEANPRLFVLYCPQSTPDLLRLSSLPVEGDRVAIDREEVLLEYAIEKDFAVHMGGGLAMSSEGELFVGTGDNSIPIPELPIDERPGNEHLDARRSSGNTRDLRGKILRIVPRPDGGYNTPGDNLFADGVDGRAEIFAMGCRNPFRIAYDDATSTLHWGDVGPNISMEVPIGPEGYDEFNATRTAGNFGWPFCVGPNEPYHDYDFATGRLGDAFDPAAPVNDSRNSNGIKNLPPARPALVWYPSGLSEEFPELGTGGRSAMSGPVYRLDDSQDPLLRLPEHYDGAWLVHDWTRNWIKAVWRDEAGRCDRIEPFLGGFAFRKPIHLRLAKDGTLFLVEFGDKWFDNRDAQISRIVYRRGNRPPEVRLSASTTVGSAPLRTTLDARETTDRDGDPLRWRWEKDGDPTPEADGPLLEVELTERGAHRYEVTATDPTGASASASIEISVGNAPPEVELLLPEDGGFFSWGEFLPYRVKVNDREDGSSERREIPDQAVAVEAVYRPRLVGETADDPAVTLMRRSTCFSCHAIDTSGGGPAYRLVSKRYEGDPEAATRLTRKVLEGGAGVWGKKAMPAHAQHTEAEALLMVEWVLKLSRDRSRQSFDGHEGALLAPERPSMGVDAGALVLRAEYTDAGSGEIPPATGSATRVLHSRRKKPAFCDASAGVQMIDVFEGEGALVGFFAPGGWTEFSRMRLADASVMRLRGRSLGGAPSRAELRLDAEDGPLVASVELPSDGYGVVEAPLVDVEGVHDVYLVAPAGEDREGDAAAVTWVEFAQTAPTPPRVQKVTIIPLPGDDSESTANHREWAGLVARVLNQVEGVGAHVSPDEGWPNEHRVIADSRVVVFCGATAGGELPEEVRKEADFVRGLGVGVVLLDTHRAGPSAEGASSLMAANAEEAATPGWSDGADFEAAIAWPKADAPEMTPWIVAKLPEESREIAWCEDPGDRGRAVQVCLPEEIRVLLEPTLRNAIVRATLWAGRLDPNATPDTWVDPLRVAPPVEEALSATPVTDLTPVPGGLFFPPQASTSSDDVDRLFWFITAVCLAFGGGITVAMVVFLLRYRSGRRRAAADLPHHDTRLEVLWSVAPALIVFVIFYWGMADYLSSRTPPDNAYEIRVRAQKWNWSFAYPNGHVDSDLHVPSATPVRLVMSSTDVIHSLFIPAFRLKMDCVPGRYSEAWFEAPEPTPEGFAHPLLCAEYCGTSHSQMLASVVVHPVDEFGDWLEKAGDLTSRLPPVEAGKLLYRRRGCFQCHSLDGARRAGGGPTFLGSFGTEQKTASGETITVDENYVRESILNPLAKIRSGYRGVMPSYQGQLKEAELDALVAFIKSLGSSGQSKPP